MTQEAAWKVRGQTLSLADPIVMGIVNVTPDSFSADGIHANAQDAVTRGLAMVEDGAAIVDVGGESTRPGATPVDASEEIRRVVPVVSRLADRGVVVSVDTSKPEVAQAAIEAGAVIINDVTGLVDTELATVCASAGVGVVIMHMLGVPGTMQDDPKYDDVVPDIRRYLDRQAGDAVRAGINPRAIVVDPGIGFGKTFEDNLEILRRLEAIVSLGYPVMTGTSRKGFLGTILRPVRGTTAPEDRDAATAATITAAVFAGAKILRVHNVRSGVEVATTAKAMVPKRCHGEEIDRT